MATPTGTKDKQGTVTIDVTIKGGQGTAPRAEAFRGNVVTWMIEGDVAPDDEVTIGAFKGNGGARSPMAGPDSQRKRKGKGPVDDSVKADAQFDTYHYDVTVTRPSGAASVIDPEIQIKP